MFNGIEEKALTWGYTGVFLLLLSLVAFFFIRQKWVALLLLMSGTFFLKLGTINLDPYLNWWDEEYHAVVAKNMMSDPFHPVFYKDPALPYDFKNWTSNKVWLHKQPMFLWQMAAGMKLFGVNETGLRIHMVFMSVILAFAIYRMGKILHSDHTGFVASFLFATGNYSIMLASGHEHTDHNDFTFMFYVTMSFWSFLEFYRCNEWKYVILTGIFAGCAVLTKWLTGLVVFSGWGLALLLTAEMRNNWRSYLYILVSILVCILVFLPWQIHITTLYPIESAYEFELSKRHFYEVMENHDGEWHYYFTNMKQTFFYLNYVYIYVIVFFLFYIYAAKNTVLKIAFVTWISVVFLFFTIAETKMPAFTFCVYPLLYILTAFFFCYFIGLWKQKNKWVINLLAILLLLPISFINLNTKKIHLKFSSDSPESAYRQQRKRDVDIIKKTKGTLRENTVILNCRQGEASLVIFYTEYSAYELPPDKHRIEEILNNGFPVAVFDSPELPLEIKNWPGVQIISPSVWE